MSRKIGNGLHRLGEILEYGVSPSNLEGIPLQNLTSKAHYHLKQVDQELRCWSKEIVLFPKRMASAQLMYHQLQEVDSKINEAEEHPHDPVTAATHLSTALEQIKLALKDFENGAIDTGVDG